MFDIVEFITRIFKKDSADSSRVKARERLKLVLVSDRASISPHLMESLKEELIQVISRYMKIDTSHIEMGLERKNGSMALAANIPILDVVRGRGASMGSVKSPLARQAASVVEQDRKLPVDDESDGDYDSAFTESVEITADTTEIDSESRKKSKKTKKRYQARAQGRTLRKRVHV